MYINQNLSFRKESDFEMAINNGNSDFNLTAVQSGTNQKEIKITFKRQAYTADPVVVEVFTPHLRVFSKTYYSTSDTETLYVKVDSFGQYKVFISQNRGYSYDYIILDVKITGSVKSDKHTFTQSEVTQYKTKGLVLNLALVITGLYNKLTWIIAATSAVLLISGYLLSDDETDLEIVPRVGWSIQHEMTQKGNTIYHYLHIWDDDGTYKGKETNYFYVDTFD